MSWYCWWYLLVFMRFVIGTKHHSQQSHGQINSNMLWVLFIPITSCILIHTRWDIWRVLSSICSIKVISILRCSFFILHIKWIGICRAYCHKIIKLSGALQEFAPEKEVISNVHGVREKYLTIGDQFAKKKAFSKGNDSIWFNLIFCLLLSNIMFVKEHILWVS